jgi:general secretion pathway protein I
LSVTARLNQDPAAGFTLLEMLVALAVLTVTLTSIGSLVAANMRGTRALEQRLALISIARAIETGLPGPTQAVDSPLTGTMHGHAWRVDYRPFTGGVAAQPSSPWIPERVTITVAARSGASFRLDTVRLMRRATQ